MVGEYIDIEKEMISDQRRRGIISGGQLKGH